jgi:hypothetical protein
MTEADKSFSSGFPPLAPALSKLRPFLSEPCDLAWPELAQPAGHTPSQIREIVCDIEQAFPSGRNPVSRGPFLLHVSHDRGTNFGAVRPPKFRCTNMEPFTQPGGCVAIVSKCVLIPKMALGSDATKMRQRASRLLDLATRSRCEGRPDYAKLLTDIATEILEHARDIGQDNESEKIGSSVGNWNGTLGPGQA